MMKVENPLQPALALANNSPSNLSNNLYTEIQNPLQSQENPTDLDGYNTNPSSMKGTKVICSDCTTRASFSSFDDMTEPVIDDAAIEVAVTALHIADHRGHLAGHLQEMTDTISALELKSNQFAGNQLLNYEAERIAEEIDETIHQLQYQLDHCRRLLQGSEARMVSTTGENESSWLTDEKKQAMSDRLKLLKLTAVHLVEHVKEEHIDQELIREMHQHMREMDHHIDHFHDVIDTWSSKWRSIPLPEIELGSTLPLSLIIPVTLDCFVDGFMIGVSVALSQQAGYVLSGANCLEMGSLGMAYSNRISKCTGSSFVNRQLAIIVPPLIMFLSSGIGAALAGSAKHNPAIFVAFVAFGIYALLQLVCGELIIEAKETQKGDDVWWVQLSLFAGVFVVLMVHPVM
jgi:hypothetical protein